MPIRRRFLAALLALPFMSRFCRGAEKVLDNQKADDTDSENMQPSDPPAFEVGEKLKYSLGWQFIVAGHAMLEVLPDEDWEGRKARSFQMTAKTGKAADALFKVRDVLSSLAEYDVSRSLGYAKIQREGSTKRDVSVDFDWENLNAHYTESLGGDSRITPILENTLDPLSAFYFIRNQTFDVGSVIKGPMTDGKRCKEAEVRVVSRERIKVNGKKYDTFKLLPDIKDMGGVFEKDKDAKVCGG